MEDLITTNETSKNGVDKTDKRNAEAKRASEWVLNIINSCKHPFHFSGAKKLIDYFGEMYGEKYGAKSLHEELKEAFYNKMSLIEIF